MGDRRQTSLKLTEESFGYLAEEREQRPVSTRQDTVEAIIQEHMEMTAESDDEQEVEPPLAAAASDLRESSVLLAVAGTASAGVGAFAGGVSWIVAATVFLAASLVGTALRFRAYRAQERDGDSDGENAGDAPTPHPRAGGD